MDYAHKETDKMLEALEKDITEVYKEAQQEAYNKGAEYFKTFMRRDKEMKAKVDAGEITEDEYKQWRINKMAVGKRYNAMQEGLSTDLANANKLAASMINNHLPDVYATNYNWSTYQIEQDARIDTNFMIYDRQTVERLIRDKPNLLPWKAAINVPEDKKWNKKNINNAITQGILLGESIPDISKRLAAVTDMNRVSAIRNARTMTTSAENGGRVDSYHRAIDMGIKITQKWLATKDNRTRHEHALLDGQEVDVGKPFKVEGYTIMFPADPQAEPHLVYNCRCTLISNFKGFEHKKMDAYAEQKPLSYKEWEEKHEPDVRIGTDFFPETAAANINAALSQMDKKTAKMYKSAIEGAPKEVVSDGTAYNKRTNIIGFDKSEVDTISGDIVIHETTHYMDFNTPMVYEQTSTHRTWARDENGNLLEKDGKPYKIEETETIRYDCNSVTSWLSFAYEDEERQSDWEKAVSILGVNKENATPFNDWIKAEDLTARREAYRQWVKDKNISQEDLPHISDVLSSFAEGQYPFSLIDGGHDISYWNEDVRHQYSECLAAYSVLKSRQSPSVKLIEGICPNLYKHLEVGYKELMKRG
jgi:hypothetical protein